MLNATISLRLVRVRGPYVGCLIIHVPPSKVREPHLVTLPNQTSTIEVGLGGALYCQVDKKNVYIYFLHKASPKWVNFLSIFYS